LKAKNVSDSRTTMTQLVLPNDANTYGNVLGGKVMHWIDLTGAISAFRHSRKPVVTVSVDTVQFHHPVKVGQVVLLEACVTRAFRTSMEVRVEVRSEDPLTGEQIRTCSAFLTFVAIDADGHPTEVPPLIPETAEEKRHYERALERRDYRLRAAEQDE
jgi:acyl-CoA hydrolase